MFQTCCHLFDGFFLFAFFARKLAEVAVLAEAESMVRPVWVVAIVRELGPPSAVVAGLTEAFGVKLFVRVRASVD